MMELVPLTVVCIIMIYIAYLSFTFDQNKK